MEEALDGAERWLTSIGVQDSKRGPLDSIDTIDPWLAIDHIKSIQASLPPKSEMINIPLNNMNIITSLMKVVVCYGLYPNTSVLIDVASRINWPLPPVNCNEMEVEKLAKSLVQILLANDDISDLIRISPCMIDIVAVTVSNDELFSSLEPVLSTYSLYEMLTQLLRPKLVPIAYTKHVAHRLALLPLQRKDAIRALIELTTNSRRQEELDLAHIDKATAVLAAPPKDVPIPTFAKAVGQQLYIILSSNTPLADPAALLVLLLADVKPAMVGPLRDSILEPFNLPGSSNCEQSLLAVTRLSIRPESKFFNYLACKLIGPIWILLAAIEAKNRPNGSTIALMAKFTEAGAAMALIQSTSFWAETWKNMSWEFTGQTATLQLTSAPPESDNGIPSISMMDSRLNLLVAVLDKVPDSKVTSFVVDLTENYLSPRGNILTSAQVLQRVAQDDRLRAKMFSDPLQIVNLVGTLLRRRPTNSLTTDSQQKSNLVADSDDEEDGEEIDSATNEKENWTLVELSLSLLNGVILDAAGNPKVLELIQEFRGDLELIAASSPRAIRDKAIFCLQLVDGLLNGNVPGVTSEQVDPVHSDSPDKVLQIARKSLADPLVPNRAYGLYLVGELVKQRELAISEAMALCLHEIKDEDSFIYLAAIKTLQICSDTFGPGPVFQQLTGLVINDSDTDMEVKLRIREVISRIVKEHAALPSKECQVLITYLLKDLRSSDSTSYQLRLSSLSLLGGIVSASPPSLSEWQESEVTECALGILQHEKDDLHMKRGALVLTLEIANSLGAGSFATVSQSTVRQLMQTAQQFESDSDETVRDYASSISSQLTSICK